MNCWPVKIENDSNEVSTKTWHDISGRGGIKNQRWTALLQYFMDSKQHVRCCYLQTTLSCFDIISYHNRQAGRQAGINPTTIPK